MATREQVDLIRKESHEGKTANQIQKDLQHRHMGMRRTRLLGYVREFKSKPPKAGPSKYTPPKYRLMFEERVRRQISERQRAKKVSVWGTVNGENRRVQLTGSGRSLYHALLDAAKHPPKKRFLTVDAENVRGFLDYDETWDRHPDVESH